MQAHYAILIIGNPIVRHCFSAAIHMQVLASGISVGFHYRAPKTHISKNKDRAVPYKSPYNEAQQGRDILTKCLCLGAFLGGAFKAFEKYWKIRSS